MILRDLGVRAWEVGHLERDGAWVGPFGATSALDGLGGASVARAGCATYRSRERESILTVQETHAALAKPLRAGVLAAPVP